MYVFLITVLLVCASVSTYARKVKLVISLNDRHEVDLDLCFCVLSVGLILFTLCFKATSIGIDTASYKQFYTSSFFEDNLSFMLNGGRKTSIFNQFLYYFIFAAMKRLGLNFRTACVVIYILAFIPIIALVRKFSRNKSMPIFLFVCLGGYSFYTSALRQTIAISIGYIAFLVLINQKRQSSKAITFALIICATLIHNTAIVLLIPFALSYLLDSLQRLRNLLIIGNVVALLFPNELISIISKVIVEDKYQKVLGESSNLLFILVYVCFAVFIYFTVNDKDIQQNQGEQIIYLLASMSIISMTLSSHIYILSRISHYFLIPLCMTISKGMENISKTKNGVMINMAIITLLLLYVIVVYFGSDAFSVYHFKFMWQVGEHWE